MFKQQAEALSKMAKSHSLLVSVSRSPVAWWARLRWVISTMSGQPSKLEWELGDLENGSQTLLEADDFDPRIKKSL